MAINASFLSLRSLFIIIHKSSVKNIRSFSCIPEISLSNIVTNRVSSSSSNLYEFIQNNPLLLRIPSSDISNSIALLQSLGLSQNSLLSIISTSPKTLDLEFLTKWQTGFSELGISNGECSSTVHMILAQSARLMIEPEDFLLSLRRMRGLGFSPGTVIRVFEAIPAAFMKDGIQVSRRVDFLEKITGIKKQDEINWICHTYPDFLAFSIDGKLRPLFSEFFNLGFDQSEIRHLLAQSPNPLLGADPGELSRCVNLLDGLKCRSAIKERILARGRLRAAVEVKIRIDFLCGHGLIRRDAFKILHVEPRSILYSTEDLERKVRFLSANMGFSVDHLVDFPDYLGVNLEKRIAPRLRVVELLRSKGALEMAVEMKHFVRLSRRKFYNFFVRPYAECEEIFGGSRRGEGGAEDSDDEKKEMKKHPNGLWKLFKPRRYIDTEEDVKNMSNFMETLG